MRVNNLSARLLVNEWLRDIGKNPPSGDLPYIEYATQLRAIVASQLELAPFHDRPGAVAYVRYVAHQYALKHKRERDAHAEA